MNIEEVISKLKEIDKNRTLDWRAGTDQFVAIHNRHGHTIGIVDKHDAEEFSYLRNVLPNLINAIEKRERALTIAIESLESKEALGRIDEIMHEKI